jgi:hypothetical protein
VHIVGYFNCSVGVLYKTGRSHPYGLCDQLSHILQLTESNHVYLSLVIKYLKFPQEVLLVIQVLWVVTRCAECVIENCLPIDAVSHPRRLHLRL